MLTKIIFLLTLIAYSVIASQSFMYILSLKHTQLNLNADSYTTVRKLIDASMRNNFKYVIYTALLTNIVLVTLHAKQPGSLGFITSAISLVALIADIFLTVKGNLPINDTINSWSAGNIPANWAHYRTKWFYIFQFRQWANISGFISLLIGIVFRLK